MSHKAGNSRVETGTKAFSSFQISSFFQTIFLATWPILKRKKNQRKKHFYLNNIEKQVPDKVTNFLKEVNRPSFW